MAISEFRDGIWIHASDHLSPEYIVEHDFVFPWAVGGQAREPQADVVSMPTRLESGTYWSQGNVFGSSLNFLTDGLRLKAEVWSAHAGLGWEGWGSRLNI